MPDVLSVDKDFNQLSLRDLLDARDQYHVHLIHKPNVVATALGRYRIRKEDPWPSGTTPRPATPKKHGLRTLENSEVRPYSWPCVLVFVEHWADPGDFGHRGKFAATDMVPPQLYLPDGRVVPVCVVQAPRYLPIAPAARPPRYPTDNIGGGFPVIARVQGQEHVATIGCLVSDGHKTYALTNRHVCGEPGEELFSRLDGKLERIGVSAGKQLTRLKFQEVYSEWPGKNVYVNLDVGLIEIDNLDRWTAKIHGLGMMGGLADLSINNISMRLIGCPVISSGSSTGTVLGEIHGLFYRYKSVGGFEYVADLLIGQRTHAKDATGKSIAPPPFATGAGNSGTLWLLDDQPDPESPASASNGKDTPRPPPRPLALQWGGHVFMDSIGQPAESFSLATCLSTVCERLGVDPVRDWNFDRPETWGAMGHYSIAARAAGALSSASPKLAKLMEANRTIMSYKDADLLTEDFNGQTKQAFVPLADVPDNVWKHGTQGHKRGREGPDHFADMDQPRGDGKTLLQLCAQDPANVDPEVWDQFYDSVVDLASGKPITAQHRGLLPFRIGQIFNDMVKFVKAKQFDRYVCAAGILAHYVGDACQPLHISYLHDGDPENLITVTKAGKTIKVPRAEGVHTAYETKMISDFRTNILNELANTPKVKASERITTGTQAALATVALMTRTYKKLPPSEIIAAFLAGKGSFPSLSKAMWDALGNDTIAVMRDGTHTLAVLWESAWVAGNGEANIKSFTPLTQAQARKIYEPTSFLESKFIADMGTLWK